MKIILKIAILIVILNNLYSQEYAVVQNNGQYSFFVFNPTNPNSDTSLALFSPRLVTNKNSGFEYFNYFSPEEFFSQFYRQYVTLPNGTSWIGRKITTGVDTNIILNINKRNILFRTSLPLSNSWIMYRAYGDTIIEAKLTDISYKQIVDDIYDTVKTYTMTAKNNDDSVITHPVNNKRFSISKNYGFVDAYDWRFFPDSMKLSYRLCGIPSPLKGIFPITIKEIYDFELGDEIHYSKGDTSNAYFNYRSENVIIVLDKQYIDSTAIDYTFGYYQRYLKKNGINMDTIISYKVANQRINLSDYKPIRPNESYFMVDMWGDSTLVDFTCKINKYGDRQAMISGAYRFHIADSIYRVGDGFYSMIFKYVEGCGDFFLQDWGDGLIWKELRYYKKKGKSWGNPYDLATSVSSDNYSGISASYNNQTNSISICFPESNSYSVQITDMKGNIVYSSHNQFSLGGTDIIPLNDANLSTGVYLALINFNNRIHTLKFLKNN